MANRYWVGGTATWDAVNTANWSASSGGASGASVPGAADVAFFDANSGAAVVTLGYSPTMLRMVCTGFTGTLDFGSNNISLSNNGSNIFLGSTTMTVLGTPVINLTYAGATGTRSIVPTAVTEANAISFNVTAGTDAFVIQTSNSGVRNLNFTGFSGSWNANAAHRIFGSLTLSTTMTVGSGTVATTFAATSGPHTITSNGKTIDWPVIFNGVGGSWNCADALTVGATRTLTLTAGTVRFRSGATSSAGTFTIAGSPSITLNATTSGSAATISQSSGTVNASNATIKDITAIGGATWNAFLINGNVDAGNNTGWDFFAQIGRYMYNVRKSKRLLI